ncbi:MAG: GIY-YIG nuclease family protein [Candidatus Nomurabacteria bacterium]|nr:MAG: GIY-YIG nuclease family protein [Candidatus Nomurabacteria bacterium]
MKSILYVITNISMPSLCKVGITDNLERRLNDLNKTGVPTRFQIYESFAIENAELLEQEVLKHFSDKRLNRRREFIEEHPERVCDFIREHKGKVRQEEESKSKFAQASIPDGAKLLFVDGEIYKNIVATVLPNGKIKFKGKETSLSTAAKDVLKKQFGKDWKAVQGTIYWTYQGKTVREHFDSIA